jgi:GntR family transcriptional regulator, transcriptional repressor for pyruvate dehydrogenase complex
MNPTSKHNRPATPPAAARTEGNVARPVGHDRAFDEIIRYVRSAVDRGELRAGDRLPPERALAEQFHVSRNMVREALRMLEISGIVELRRGATGGAFICRGEAGVVARSLTDMMRLAAFSLEDLTEARLWLSSMIIGVVGERATADDLDRLDENVAAAGALIRRGEWTEMARRHIEFHIVLAEATGNPVLVMIQRSVMEVMAEISRALGPIRDEATLRSRRRFMRHLRAGDIAAATAEMERCLRRIHAVWLAGAAEVGRSNG